VELLWKLGDTEREEWKSVWKPLLEHYYIKKARSCEQALGVVCGNVASETKK
jgi:hypothetical protein